jgi:leucyl aminopeptidase
MGATINCEAFVEIKVKTAEITRLRVDALALPVFEGTKKLSGPLAALDKRLGGTVLKLLKSGEVNGGAGEVTVIFSLGKITAERVVLLGLGRARKLDAETLRAAAALFTRRAKRQGWSTLALLCPDGPDGLVMGQAVAEGAELGGYAFTKYFSKPDKKAAAKRLTLIEENRGRRAALKAGTARGQIMASAQMLARDLVNEPSNRMTPTDVAEAASKVAEENGLTIEVHDREWITAQGMGCLLGVNRGSAQPPQFIRLDYRGGKTETLDLVLIGKGVTFDSGGISIKPSEGMGDMKGDMAGAAAVIAAMEAIGQLKPNLNVTALVAATENMPDGDAYKPGDVLTAMNGKTVEIVNTDAEGRLTLADALCYANSLKAKRLVDVATLTGACQVALGVETTGAFGNNQRLMKRLLQAAKTTGERTWELPMDDVYKELNRSDIADVKNAGSRWGGAISAAQFLHEFAGNTPWVHLDIAGTSDTTREAGYLTKGATGAPVRTLVTLVLEMAA